MTEHLALTELACHDGTPYPVKWYLDRLPRVRRAFETIRAFWGTPLIVLSAYRTPAFNKQIGGAEHSLHCEGLALDLAPPQGVSVQDFWVEIVRLADKAGIGGVGYASPSQGGYVHIDCRPRNGGRVAQWRYPLRDAV